jgi:hypothetical protein
VNAFSHHTKKPRSSCIMHKQRHHEC